VVVDVSGPEVGFEVGFSETHLAVTRARRGFAAVTAEPRRSARLCAASSAEPPPDPEPDPDPDPTAAPPDPSG
jgi:hypothetical protein